ncbi:MAG: type IV pilin [Halobacteriales archaeon]
MSDELGGDRVLTLVGVGLVVAIVVALGFIAVGFTVGSSEDQMPDADLSLERVNKTHAKIVHKGGEPIKTENLVLTVDSYEREQLTRGMSRLIVEGDEIVFDVRDDQSARLVYDLGRGDREIVARLRPSGL